MKRLTPLILLAAVILTSCSSNEAALLNNEASKNLLQSYTLKRDVNGAYSIDFKTADNTDVVAVTNENKTNDFILSEVNHKTANNHNNKFNIKNDLLKIGFLDQNKGKRTRILVEDENITLAKGGVTDFLNSYSITKKIDGTYLLNFKVNNNVATEFTFNEDLEIYEVHLSKGKSKKQNFSREITVSSNKILKLDFVNYYNYSARDAQDDVTPKRKPRLSIGGQD